MDQKRSLMIFIGLMVLYGVLTAASVYLPQGPAVAMPTPAQMPASKPVMAVAAGGAVLVIYGALGLVGIFLWRRLGLPELWDSRATNRQRFVLPALAGAAVGVFLLIMDVLFGPVNGIGRLPHPPFPTSLVAALAAGIGEETIFRLFFVSLWTWFISSVLLRGKAQPAVYWVVAVFSAVVFSLAHLPAVLVLMGWDSLSSVPPLLLVELLLLNGSMSLVGAYLFRKYGFLATVGVHFWADVVWHVIWGALG